MLRTAMTTVALLGTTAAASAALYEVGPGKTYSTIQGAVNAAAAADVATPGNNVTRTDPVEIVVYGGTYSENVTVPADTSGGVNGYNDGWTIRNAANEKVWLNGRIYVNQGRDSGVIDGINIKQTAGSGYAYAFTAGGGNTARYWTIKNGIVYSDGTNTNAAYYGYLQYGNNTLDHMTFYNVARGLNLGYSGRVNLTNSIIVNASIAAISAGDSSSTSPTSSYSYSLLFGNTANITGTSMADGGNNVFEGPVFASVDPNSPDFLKLLPDSPAVGVASSSGQFTGGNHIGAMGIVPEPASCGLLLLGAAAMATRRRRSV